VQLEPDPEKRLKYADFVDIYADLTDAERQRYQRDYPEETKTMQSLTTRMREEGTKIGIQLGEATMLLFQLEQKFGAVPDAMRQRGAGPDRRRPRRRAPVTAASNRHSSRRPPLPVPTLRIEEEALGQPRQPVPLRLARLVTGLTTAEYSFSCAGDHRDEIE